MSTEPTNTPISQALVLAPDFFLSPVQDVRVDRISPARSVLGVPVLVRVLRQLQDAGVSRSLVILPPEWTGTALTVKKDFRITHEVTFLTADRTDDCSKALREAAGQISGPAFVCRSDLVAPADLFKRLAESKTLGEISAAVEKKTPAPFDMRLLEEDEHLVKSGNGGMVALSGLMLAPDGFFHRLHEGVDLETVFDDFLSGKKVKSFRSSHWRQAVRFKADFKTAEDKLLNSLRKPIDGLIARSINRNLSLPVSRRLAYTFVTPNMASLSTPLFVILAVVLLSKGGYGNLLAAALLFQISSIVDGIDGELARLKYQFSKYGEWFDTLADDFCTYTFFGGLTYAVWSGATGPEWLAVFGLITMAAYALVTPMQYSYILMYTDSGDVYAIDYDFSKDGESSALGGFAPVLNALKYVVKRDFFIFSTFVAAVLGVLPYMLILTALGAVSTAAVLFRQHALALKRKRNGKE